MKYFSPTLWREIRFPAAERMIQLATVDDIILAYYSVSFFLMFTALWIRPFKHAHTVFMCSQLAALLCLDFAIDWTTIESDDTELLIRAVYLIYFVFLNYVAALWVQHCAFDFPLRKPLTEEEKKSATRWQRFCRSRFFLNRFTMGSGRWATYLGTNSWHIAVLWRLSIPLLFAELALGTGIVFSHRNARLFGYTVVLAALATVWWRDGPKRAEDLVDSVTSASEEEQALLEKEKVVEV